MNPNTTNQTTRDVDSEANATTDVASSSEHESQSVLLICSGACLGLVLGASLTVLLVNRYSVLWTCSGLMLMFLLPMIWFMCRQESGERGVKELLARKLEQTWVISFWCICSLVLLLIATM